MNRAVDVVDVFLLAENRLFREALAKVIGKQSDLRVVGASAFEQEAFQSIVDLDPHVVLWDPASDDPDLQLIRSLRQALSTTKLMMIGMDDNAELFLRCVRAGVAGYLLKDASAGEVAVAIRTVAYDGAICSARLCMQLFNYCAAQPGQTFTYLRSASLGLSRREQQLVEMVGRGLTNKEIANNLNLSEQTIKNHIHRILRKLGTTDRLSAVEMCRAQGIFA